MLRKVGWLALCLALTLLVSGIAQTAQAMPLAGSARPSETEGVMARVWGWIEALFRAGGSPSGDVTSTWEADGSHLDPHG